MKAVLNFWINSYCSAEHQKCSRFQLSQSGKPVPLGLLPNGDMLGPPPEK